MSVPTDPDEMLCYCLGVRYRIAEQAIREQRLDKVSEVTQACKAGGGCRSCHPEIRELIEQVQRERGGGGFLERLARILGGRTR